jgi:16S rRNA (guanine527-N7)-methyltransferase
MSSAGMLERGLEALHLELSPETQRRLLEYLALIRKWNRVYNLTAVREEQKMISHHLLDSLAVIPHVAAASIVDVGSGAGLPGIPLALAMPHSTVTLLEASQKKAAFLRQTAIELGLANVSIVCERAETWRPHTDFAAVISRAFSGLPEYVAVALHLCAKDGVMAAMKGVYPHEEIAQLPPGVRLRAVIPLDIPGLEAQRHLVLMQPS